MTANDTQATELARQVAKPMPMCSVCKRPLGLFYAECMVCLGNANLHAVYYEQWCEWQQRNPPARTDAGGRDE